MEIYKPSGSIIYIYICEAVALQGQSLKVNGCMYQLLAAVTGYHRLSGLILALSDVRGCSVGCVIK